MNQMQCERARELLGPYVDGELPAEEHRAVAAHVEACSSCSAEVSDYRRIGLALAEGGRTLPSEAVRARVRAGLVHEAAHLPGEGDSPQTTDWRRLFAGLSPRQAAAMAAMCLLTALATWWIVGNAAEGSRLEREVLAAHIRSLLQESPIQIASSDSHTVKPWFTGRVDFAPEVKDLSAEGFPLLGGRVDYIGDRRVSALVLKRRLHTINLFMWPSPEQPDAPVRIASRNGYNLIFWSKAGLTYWAVSDLGASDLRQLPGLL
jgi:anti-sigma factor RsiW